MTSLIWWGILILRHAISQSVVFTNVSKVIELNAMEPMNLNAECSVNSYIDEADSNFSYYWISSIKPGSIVCNIYNNELIQYNGANSVLSKSLPFDVGADNPESIPLGQCKSPFTNDIIVCYNGGNALYANEKYIYCAMFHYNTSKMTKTLIVNNPDASGLEFVGFPQVLCQKNGYIVFYTQYIGDNNDIVYSLLDIAGNIISKENKLNTKQQDIEQNFFQLTQFNDTLFLMTMAYFNNNGPIGWIGYDDVDRNNSIKLMSSSYFHIIDAKHTDIDNYNTMTLNVTNDCCFIVMYTMYYSLNKNSLYVSVIDINGNKVISQDVLISRNYDAYFCGGIELKMLNKMESNFKYFLIYESSDTFLYGYVYQLIYKANQYQLIRINNNVILQVSAEDYAQVCFSNLNHQLFAATFNGNPFNGKNPKMYAQTWNVTLF